MARRSPQVLQEIGAFVRQKSTLSREPDAIRPVPQWHEITEWERQIVKEQEREREGPNASDR